MTVFWRAAPLIFLILWSGGYGFAKLGLEHAEPMTLRALRYGLAVAVLAPLAVALMWAALLPDLVLRLLPGL